MYKTINSTQLIRMIIRQAIPMIWGIIRIAFFVLYSLGLYFLAKNRKLEHPWLAFIPFAQNYLLGELTGNKMWGIKASKWILSIGSFSITLLKYIPVVKWTLFPILTLVFGIYYFMVLYKLYKLYCPEKAKLFIILSILFSGIARPLIVFGIRNRKIVSKNSLREELIKLLQRYDL